MSEHGYSDSRAYIPHERDKSFVTPLGDDNCAVYTPGGIVVVLQSPEGEGVTLEIVASNHIHQRHFAGRMSCSEIVSAARSFAADVRRANLSEASDSSLLQ